MTELVVTIVILGLLASIAGVAYSNFLTDTRREALRADALVFDQAYRAKMALDTLGSGANPVTGEAARVAAVVAAFSGDSAPSYAAGLEGAAGQVEFTKSGVEVCLALPASLAAAVSVTDGECVSATAPGAPTGLTVTAGNTTAALSWTAPADNGGAAITDYMVEFSDDEGISWDTFNDGVSTETSATVTGLTNGTVYTFRVAAVNVVGTGTASASFSGTPVTTPGAPTALAATPDTGSVALSWQAPASTGGAALTDYVLEFSTNGGSSWSVFTDGVSTSTSALLTGLQNDTAYSFRVAAVNVAGTGAWSSTASATTPVVAAPSAPANLTIAPGSWPMEVSWDSAGVSAWYSVDYNLPNWPNTWFNVVSGATNTSEPFRYKATTFTISTSWPYMTPDTGYRVRVRAYNSFGSSSFSTVEYTSPPAP